MRPQSPMLAVFAAMSLIGPAALGAQVPGGGGGGALVMPFIGYAMAENLVHGPLGSSAGTAGGPLYGVQVSLPVMPVLALLGSADHSRSDLRAGIPLLGHVGFGEVSTLRYDAGVEIRLPASGASPFVQAGVGGVRRDLSVAGLSTSSTAFALYAGGGVDLGLLPGFGARILLRDHVSRFDAREAVGIGGEGETGHGLSAALGLRISL